MLQRGDTGNDVTLLQNGLFICGYGQIAVDGIFGSETEAAVIQMQNWHGINTDGIYGPISEGKLVGEIEYYQTQLGIPVTGYADYTMQSAVRAFQASHPPLAVDGIIGHETDAALLLAQQVPPAAPSQPAPIHAVPLYPWRTFNTNFSDHGFELTMVTGWISYQFAKQMIIDKYMLRAPPETEELWGMPKDWIFQAFNGQNWILLDTQRNQLNWHNLEERVFLFHNTTPYPLYRLKISANNGGLRTTVDQLAMYYGGGS